MGPMVSLIKRLHSIINKNLHLLDNGVTRCTAINKEEVLVIKSSVGESLGIVESLIESDNSGNLVVTKVREIELRSMERIS